MVSRVIFLLVLVMVKCFLFDKDFRFGTNQELQPVLDPVEDTQVIMA